MRRGGAEANPDYDLATWLDVPASANSAIEQWGIYYGPVWYRTTYTGVAQTLRLNARHHASVYLNGVHVQSVDWNPPPQGPDDEPPVDIALPHDRQHTDGENVLAVLVEHLGHNKGFVGNDARNPRGILDAALDGAAVAWRLRAGLVPGPTGDVLGAERTISVESWEVIGTGDSLPALPKDAPLVAYTSVLSAPIPAGHWAPLEIEIDACPGKGFLIVNGTVIGRVWAAKGPQHRFVVPPTWLNADGEMEMTLLVWPRADAGPVGPVRALREPIHRVTTL